MNAEDKIARAKVQLILNHPFFASIALQLPYRETDAVPTAATDGEQILYNPDFIDSLKEDTVTGLMAHEVLHVAYMHPLRRQGRDKELWNVAADYAINLILVEAGFQLPEGGLIYDGFKDMTAEQIYSVLEQKMQQASSSGGDGEDGDAMAQAKQHATFGEVIDPNDGKPMSDSVIREKEAAIERMVAQAAEVARMAGKLPGGIERMVTELLNPRLNWREILERFVAEITRNDYNWKRPSPRYLHQGVYLPLLESLDVGKIVLIVDTSGSIDEHLLSEFGAEIKAASSRFKFPVTVLYVDTEVHEPQELESGTDIDPVGGGGTDFVPGFEYIEKEMNDDIRAVIYFTDGWCSSFPETPPDYPVLWAVYDYDEFDPPFGEVIHIDTK